jgi:hypothetical protein
LYNIERVRDVVVNGVAYPIGMTINLLRLTDNDYDSSGRLTDVTWYYGYASGEFALDGLCSVLETTLAFSDGSPADAEANIKVYTDGATAYERTIRPGDVIGESIAVENVSTLKLEFSGEKGSEDLHLLLGSPKVTCSASLKP